MRRGYAVYICGGPSDVRVVPNPTCPSAAEHTPQPPGYTEWHEWAEEMGKTHKQQRCAGCHLLNIWAPK